MQRHSSFASISNDRRPVPPSNSCLGQALAILKPKVFSGQPRDKISPRIQALPGVPSRMDMPEAHPQGGILVGGIQTSPGRSSACCQPSSNFYSTRIGWLLVRLHPPHIPGWLFTGGLDWTRPVGQAPMFLPAPYQGRTIATLLILNLRFE